MTVRLFLAAGLGALALTMAGCGKKDKEPATDAGDIRVDPALTQENARMLKAPPPTIVKGSGQVLTAESVVAAPQGCGKKLAYSLDYAKRLPAALPLYPDAKLTEAAGADAANCSMRAVSFTSSAPMATLIDWHYTQAIRAGYSSEHQIKDGDHILAGVREEDGGAYYILFAEHEGGGVEVDLIANNGL